MMSWETVIQEQAEANQSLIEAIERLFSCQRRDWPAFRQGESALAGIQRTTLTHSGSKVLVQANPGRRKSTHAKTDPNSIASRKCFLCPENMPPEERGVAFGDLVILPNPYPILTNHCTIPDRVHRPQLIGGRPGMMLNLARCLGPTMVVFYNGPRCGASAPDHFHFQACHVAGIPLLHEHSKSEMSHSVSVHESFGRRFLLVAGADVAWVQQKLERIIDVLRETKGEGQEPMMNLIVHSSNDGFRVLCFPREAHRPSCYFASEAERLSVSPAALEMAGVIVVSEPEQLERVDAQAVLQIYSEVSLNVAQFTQLAEAIR